MVSIIYKGFNLFSGIENGPVDLNVSINGAVQNESILRSDTQKVFGRKNCVTTVSFSLEREFDTVVEAENFMVFHASEIPDNTEGDLVFELDPGIFVTLENASWNSITFPEIQGVSVTTQYNFTGERFIR